MNIDDIRKYVVVVNGGSGCIFQPVDKEYSYILTAKHNLTDNNHRIDTLMRFQYDKYKWEKSPIEIDSLVEGRNYFSHPEKDIAILKINRITDLEPIHRIDTNDILQEPDNYCLCGYPETRRNAEKDESEKDTEDESRWYRIDQGITIKDCKNNGLREAQVPNNAGIEEIRGHSGGCLVKISGDDLLLAGIQNKMAPAKDEALGNILFSTIDNFDEITEKYADCLSPLLPPYCVSFECLCNQVMQLEGYIEDISYAKSRLQEIASDIAGHPLTPLAIKNKLKTRMLVAEEKENSLYGKGLWKAWLELLIVLNIIQKEPQTEEELEDIFKQYRLLYSSTHEQWTNYLKQIACSDYRGVKENACIIVANEGIPVRTILKKGIIPNIGQPLTPRQLNIDEGISNPFKSFKFIHIHAFQRDCILKDEEKFTIFNCEADAELLQELKRSYEDILNN